MTRRTIRLDLEYDGTDFHGYAPQPGLRTVGGDLEAALQRVLHHPLRLSSGGRTDAGVHARGQVVTLQTESSIDCESLRQALNALLGSDLRVLHSAAVCDTFDARLSAVSRRYGYALWTASERNIWSRRWTAHIAGSLEVERMDAACQCLIGRHDFAAFRTHRTQDPAYKGTIRRVHAASWTRDDIEPQLLHFRIEADAFLRHMVRTIVGTSIQIGLGKLPPTELATAMQRGERAAAGPTAPAGGLTLLEIVYPGSELGANDQPTASVPCTN